MRGSGGVESAECGAREVTVVVECFHDFVRIVEKGFVGVSGPFEVINISFPIVSICDNDGHEIVE